MLCSGSNYSLCFLSVFSKVCVQWGESVILSVCDSISETQKMHALRSWVSANFVNSNASPAGGCAGWHMHRAGCSSRSQWSSMISVREIKGVLFHPLQTTPCILSLLALSLSHEHTHKYIHKHNPIYSRRTPLQTWPQPLFPTWSSLMQPPTWADTRRFLSPPS